ncbi:hypothetical protein JQK88_27765 [Mesorhizobium caraganae]|uniref:hypothetical protein n=1 Tax=Mesorhizobium caraganae TaxID=483206 RepID=UPI001782A48F|nr:hypothetical protein [Mesorhizobium caraganae]MBM2714956.1 hypothetical protein [Mesorhizobium caraganae]
MAIIGHQLLFELRPQPDQRLAVRDPRRDCRNDGFDTFPGKLISIGFSCHGKSPKIRRETVWKTAGSRTPSVAGQRLKEDESTAPPGQAVANI